MVPLSLIIATRNAHKVREIRALLPDSIQVLSQLDFPDAPVCAEDADNFAGNAAKKALELARWLASSGLSTLNLQLSTCFVLADDSGLEVDALNGAPGVHSARFATLDESSASGAAAGRNSSDASNNEKLLRLLKDVPLEKRTARFRCVLAVAGVNPGSKLEAPQLFEGVCEGRINFAPSGQGGFGYDPLFIPLGQDKSFAELGDDLKNRISHRARAMEKLKGWLLQPPSPLGADGSRSRDGIDMKS